MRRLTGEDLLRARIWSYRCAYPNMTDGDVGMSDFLNALLFADNDEYRPRTSTVWRRCDSGPWLSERCNWGWDVDTYREGPWFTPNDCESAA